MVFLLADDSGKADQKQGKRKGYDIQEGSMALSQPCHGSVACTLTVYILWHSSGIILPAYQWLSLGLLGKR